MADMRRPSSVPSEDYYTKTRMTNSRTRSASASIQGDPAPLTLGSIITSNRSLFLLSEGNIIRKVCKKIVESKVSFISRVYILYGVVYIIQYRVEYCYNFQAIIISIRRIVVVLKLV